MRSILARTLRPVRVVVEAMRSRTTSREVSGWPRQCLLISEKSLRSILLNLELPG